jgi:non-heme chloroperoxidase
MPSIQNGDVTISYEVHGSGDRNVVLVHGWGLSSVSYEELLKQLDTSGLRLIVPDLRGTGRSSAPSTGYTLENYVSDVMAVANDARADKFVIVGHSMGGQIAMWIASKHPDRVLGQALINPVPPTGFALPPDAEGLFRGSAGSAEAHGTIFTIGCKDLKPEVRARLLEDAVKLSPACISESLDAWSKASFLEAAQKVTAPTLVIASDDPFFSPEFLKEKVAQIVPGGRVAIVRGGGHHVNTERPFETAQVLSAFFAGVRWS